MKKQKINYLPIVIAAAGAGAIWYFRKDIGNFLGINKKAEAGTDEILTLAPEISSTPVVTIPAQTQTIKTLSPLGTPKDKLQFNTELSLGDKGQEVAKLQQILNRISKIYGTQAILSLIHI